MLRNINSLIGSSIQATDGELGRIKEFLFDDTAWQVRYLVVETGGWLANRKVLISPAAIKRPDWTAKGIPVALTREQVRKSPDIDTEKPVYRQHEIALARHYGWRPFWEDLVTGFPFLPEQAGIVKAKEMAAAQKANGDPHLRSTLKVTGYGLRIVDGKVGTVEDYLLDDAAWRIRYLVANINFCLPGRKVLIPSSFAKNLDWENSELSVALTMETLRNSPEYNPSQPVSAA